MKRVGFNKTFPFVLLLLLLCNIYQSKAQFLARSEIGLFLGGSNYMGDLNNLSPLGTVSPAGGLIYRYTINSRWVIKADALYGWLKGGNPDIIEMRNLSFKSYIFEGSIQMEFNFLPYYTGDVRDRWAPYLFAGVGFFSFNPKAYYDGVWYDLNKLGTEGQGSAQYQDRKPYSLVQLSIPMGIGFKFSIAKNISLGVEYGIRKTFTDYIDDVSKTYVEPNVLSGTNGQMSVILSDRTNELPGYEGIYNVPGSDRGNAALDDWYAFFGVTLTFSMGFLVPKDNCRQDTFKYYDSRKRYPRL